MKNTLIGILIGIAVNIISVLFTRFYFKEKLPLWAWILSPLGGFGVFAFFAGYYGLFKGLVTFFNKEF